jgi:hypothetical protein
MNLLEENIKRIKQLMILEDQLDTDINLSKTGSDQDIKQKGPSTDDGDNDAEDGMSESELDEEEVTTDTTTDTKTDTGSSITPWESGRTLGPTYKGPNAKWESGVGKGPGNKTATEKWSSGRTMGPTGKNYKT